MNGVECGMILYECSLDLSNADYLSAIITYLQLKSHCQMVTESDCVGHSLYGFARILTSDPTPNHCPT